MQSESITLPGEIGTVIEWHGAEQAQPRATILFLPALGVPVRFYRGFAEAWAQLGFRVAAVEMRGMPQSSVRDVRRHNFGYRELVHNDIPALVEHVLQKTGGVPLYLAGHSLGGQLALLHASRDSSGIAGIAGIILIAAGSNFHGSMPSRFTNLRRYWSIQLVRAINNACGYFPGHLIGFGGRQPRNLMADWAHECLHGYYQVIGDDTDHNAALQRLRLPVLMATLSQDWMVPHSSSAFLARKLTAAAVSRIELDARDHGLEQFHHFYWVRTPQPVLGAITDWLDVNAPAVAPAQAAA